MDSMRFEKNRNKVTFITWQPYCSRSDNIAREFNGSSFKIYYEFFGSNYYTILFKYFLQFLRTLFVLFRELPDTVFVMNPPVFACIPVYFYCILFKKKYIIDMHTGAMADPIWGKVRFLQKYFSRRALLSMITNEEIGEELRQWGCKYKIVPDVPIRTRKTKTPNLNDRFNVTLVNTFSKDEPLEHFLNAAETLDEVDFFITGKMNKKNFHFVGNTSKNIRFTDFLPDNEYYGLLLASDLVVVLTTRDKTMQRGAYEAIYLGKPVVTSDWKVLRDNFSKGAVFVDNTSSGIMRGIKLALQNLDRLKIEANVLRRMKQSLWENNYKDLKCAIEINSRDKD